MIPVISALFRICMCESVQVLWVENHEL